MERQIFIRYFIGWAVTQLQCIKETSHLRAQEDTKIRNKKSAILALHTA